MSSPSHQLTLACETCKARKRKCDKALPKCSLCTSKGLSCRYPTAVNHSSHTRTLPSPQSSSSSTAVSPASSASRAARSPNNFPPVFYLDFHVFRKCHVEFPKPTFSIPLNVSKLIGNSENWDPIATEYFATTHTWMPIISKSSFYAHIHAPSGQLRSDYALLLLAMDLICWVPENGDPKTPAYLAAKSFYLDLEIQGFVSLQILQAQVLIALFEFGHAIFPSATVSIEACVRYGCALGINWDARFPAKRPFSWVDGDEMNRVWWAIVILDRVSRIGYPARPFLTEDPSPETIMPSDDGAWDEGIMPPKCFSVLHAQNPRKLGRYALTAEATRLLGQIIRHVEAETFGDQFHGEEALLLDRALRALVSVTEFEGQNHDLDVMNQTLMCSIALILLHEAHASKKSGVSEYFDRIHHAQHVTKLVVKARDEMTGLETPFQACVRSASPFMTILMYQTAAANLRRCLRMKTDESAEAFAVMKAALEGVDGRWRSSGAYLQIVEAREVIAVR